MKKLQKQPDWNNQSISLLGKEIEFVPIQYNDKLSDDIDKMEYYLRRGNKYYFRNMFTSIMIESKDLKTFPLKYGQKITIDIQVNTKFD